MQTAEKISITMTPEMLRDVRESVEAGEFASTSEALRDAVRVWKRERSEHAARMAAIRDRVRVSVNDPRPDLSGDDVKTFIRAIHAETVKGSGFGEA